jgi:uncharacterized protein YjbI with pentapeptide repeats
MNSFLSKGKKMNVIITSQQLRDLLLEHEKWVRAYGRTENSAGMRLVVHDSILAAVEVSSQVLSSCEIQGCTVERAKFLNCDFSSADLIDNVFDHCTFEECRFTKADLRGSNCRTSRFNKCDFSRADLTDVDFRGAELIECSFAWAWLVNTDLRYANLEGTSFTHARLSRTKLFNNNRFKLGEMDGVVVKNADFSANGDGKVVMGAEVFDYLRAAGR